MSSNLVPQEPSPQFIDRYLHMEMPAQAVPVNFIDKPYPEYTETVRAEIADADQESIIRSMIDDTHKRGLIAQIYDLQVTLMDEEIESRTDPLTGVGNRKKLNEELEKIIGLGHELDVVFIDFNNFKKINDTFGHSVGDIALKTTARNLSKILRKGERVFRYGGDEFIVVRDLTVSAMDRRQEIEDKPETENREDPRRKNNPGDSADIEGLSARIKEAFIRSDESFKFSRSLEEAKEQMVSATTGHATYQAGDTIEYLIERAGRKMQDSKPKKTAA